MKTKGYQLGIQAKDGRIIAVLDGNLSLKKAEKRTKQWSLVIIAPGFAIKPMAEVKID